MVLLIGGDIIEDYIYQGYTEDEIYYGLYIKDEIDDDEELELLEELELEKKEIFISKWEYHFKMLI
jgi:hypothetical protein